MTHTGAGGFCDRFNVDIGCDVDSLGDYNIGWTTAKSAVLAASIAKDATDAAEFPGVSAATAAALAVASIALEVIEGVKDAVDYADGVLGAAIVAATWQNAKVIIANQIKVQENTYRQGDRLDTRLTDKFSITPSPERRLAAGEATRAGHTRARALFDADQYLRGYGCDSIDNDDNLFVDECGEDKVPATLQLPYGATCLEDYFLEEDDLRACVERHLRAADDCHPVNIPTFERLVGTCGDVYLDYAVDTATCAAENHVEERFGPFQLDLTPPALAPLQCPASPLPHTLRMIDIGPLGIAATDDCGIANVTVTVKSDEVTATVSSRIYEVHTRCTAKETRCVWGGGWETERSKPRAHQIHNHLHTHMHADGRWGLRSRPPRRVLDVAVLQPLGVYLCSDLLRWAHVHHRRRSYRPGWPHRVSELHCKCGAPVAFRARGLRGQVCRVGPHATRLHRRRLHHPDPGGCELQAERVFPPCGLEASGWP